MADLLHALVFDYTLRTVALGAAVLGVTAGALGAFAVLRGQSLIGDAVSHAALPGVVLAFLITGAKGPLALAVGAGLAGWLGTAFVRATVRRTRVPFDAALGIVLSTFFGFGLLLMVIAQRRPEGTQAGLDHFLFGQAAALVARDVWTMAALGAAALLALALLWKELKGLAFDPEFMGTLGFPVRALDGALMALLVVAVVVGLQAVGVVLMSALLVAPAAAARQWTDRLGPMVLLSALFGAISGVSGAVISATAARLPTGPTVVLVAGGIVVVSLLVAPRRGLLAGAVRRWRNRANLREIGVLEDLYTLALGHPDDPLHPHEATVLRTMTRRPESVEPGLHALAERGLVAGGDGRWGLTEKGLRAARTFSREIGHEPDETERPPR